MKNRNLLLAMLAILVINGCADKKKSVVKRGQNSSTIRSDRDSRTQIYGNSSDTNSYGGYSNVDPYGYGNYGNNGSTYNDGGLDYSNNSSYMGSNIKNIYFNVDQYNITSDKLPIIHNNYNVLKSKISKRNILKIEGNCDASGSDEYNYALGLKRAKAVKESLINEGIKDNNIVIVSLGESSPECVDSSSASCYAKNRRVEFKLTTSN